MDHEYEDWKAQLAEDAYYEERDAEIRRNIERRIEDEYDPDERNEDHERDYARHFDA